MSEQHKASYDNFAFFYNKYWTLNTPYIMMQALDILYLYDKISSLDILDVCCGTGNVAAILKKQGHNVMGLDSSAGMLVYAKNNAPEVEFVIADARSFELPKSFDLVISLFDSVNHFTEPDDIVEMFKRIYSHMHYGGVFIFDVNSLESCRNSAEMNFTAVQEDDVIITKTSFNEISKLSTYDVVTFLKEDGEWRRSDAKIVEKYYSPEEITALLRAVGFSNISIAEGKSDLGIESFKNRLFFAAYKEEFLDRT